jgi:hypothetical protein
MSTVQIPYSTFKKMQDDISVMKQLLFRMSGIKTNDWVSEEDAMVMTSLSKRSLFNLRKNNTINWSTASGRKIKYSRKDLENYLNHNSTLKSCS